jgi:hypothetical protein
LGQRRVATRAASFLGLAVSAVIAMASCTSSNGASAPMADASGEESAPDGGSHATGDASADTPSVPPGDATADAAGDAAGDALADAHSEAGPCPAGQTSCGGSCVATKVDPANCGSCGAACTSGRICSNGQCSLSCGGGTTQCGSACVDTNVDPSNCGRCGHTCQTGQLCSAGQCTTQCGGGLTMCPGAGGDGGGTPVCVDAQNDPDHCGGCGSACSAGNACSAGVCAVLCPGMQVNCNGLCIDPSRDDQYCGASGACGAGDAGSRGTQCPSGQVCVGGICSVSCPGTEINCGGKCVDPASDPQHCGATAGCGVAGAGSAGSACAVGGSCNGTCGCPAAEWACGAAPGACTDISVDPQNCGACGHACGPYPQATATCGGGACALICSPGFLDCDGNTTNGCETNGQTDPGNCGTCGHRCGAPCNAGVCEGSNVCTEAQDVGTIPLTGATIDVLLVTRRGLPSLPSMVPCATASGGLATAVTFSVASAADITFRTTQLGNHAWDTWAFPPPEVVCDGMNPLGPGGALLACSPAIGFDNPGMAIYVNVQPGRYFLVATGDQPGPTFSGALDLSISAMPH